MGSRRKTLVPSDIDRLITLVRTHRHPERDLVLLLLSVEAGLKATQIANLRWEMVSDLPGKLGYKLHLDQLPGKRTQASVNLIAGKLGPALRQLKGRKEMTGPVISSDQGEPLQRDSIVKWFRRIYDRGGLKDFTSRTGWTTAVVQGIRLELFTTRDISNLAIRYGFRSVRALYPYFQTFIEDDPGRWAHQSRRWRPPARYRRLHNFLQIDQCLEKMD